MYKRQKYAVMTVLLGFVMILFVKPEVGHGFQMLYDVKAIEAGNEFSGALQRDGAVLTWGQGFFGQLGGGLEEFQRPFPAAVPDLKDVVRLDSGGNHFAVIKSDGTVRAWGDNYCGELGVGTANGNCGSSNWGICSPVQVIDPSDSTGYLTNIAAIAAGNGLTMFVKTDGTVWGVGTNANGELGIGALGGPCGFSGYCTPVQVKDPGDPTGFFTGVLEVSSNGGQTLALKSDGTVWAWGRSYLLGVGEGYTWLPRQVLDPGDPTGYLTGIIAIDAGSVLMALKEDGTVWTWGRNSFYTLGHGPGDDKYYSTSVPHQVEDPADPTTYLTQVIAIAVGNYRAAVLKSDGTVWVWGENRLSDGTTLKSTRPVQVVDPDDPTGYLTKVMAISAGKDHIMALKLDGSVWAWEGNYFGQLGDATTENRVTPVQVKVPSGLIALPQTSLGQIRISPGEELQVMVFYQNVFNETLHDAIIAVDIPDSLVYVASTQNGIYRYDVDSFQLYWELGNVEPSETGWRMVKMKLPWGAHDQAVDIAATIGATNMTSIIDVADYLLYSAKKMIGETSLSEDEIQNLLLTDQELEKQFSYALKSGYEFYNTAKVTEFQDGSSITTFAMLDPNDLGLVYLRRTEDGVHFEKFVGNTYSVFDDEGGFSVDTNSGAVNSWGTWSESHSLSTARCIYNCLGSQVAYMVIKKFLAGISAGDAMVDCIKCEMYKFSDPPTAAVHCAKCLEFLLQFVPVASISAAVGECIGACLEDSSSHYCTEDKKECGEHWLPALLGESGEGVWTTKCDKATGRWGMTTFYWCSYPRVKCINGECIDPSSVRCGGPCTSTPPSNITPTSSSVAVMVQLPASIGSAHDPNVKSIDFKGNVIPGQTLTYTIEYENEGRGTAYGVFILDELNPSLDESSLVLNNGGAYTDSTRLLEWNIGVLGPGEKGSVSFSVNIKDGITNGTEIVNFADIHFPSAAEVTPTNPVLNIVRTIAADPQTLETISGTPLPITLTGRDIYGTSPLSFQVTSGPLYGILEGVAPNVTYTSENAFSGDDEFYFIVNNGNEDSEPAKVTVRVNPNPADAEPPQVIDTYPQSDAINVHVTDVPRVKNPDVYAPSISALFSEQINPATLTSDTFTVTGLTGIVDYNQQLRTAYFHPTSALSSSTTYTVSLTTGITDLNANPMAFEYSWQFTTESSVNLTVTLPDNAVELDFGEVEVGSLTPAKIVNIESTGSMDLQVLNIALEGASSGHFVIAENSCSGATLAPLENCTLKVAFQPSSAGEKSATLIIESTDSDQPTINIPLRGLGTTTGQLTLSASVSPVGSGIVTGEGISCPGDCSETYNQGSDVTLTADPADGYVLESWEGCDTSSGNQCHVTLNSPRSVTAYFTILASNHSPDVPSAPSPQVGAVEIPYESVAMSWTCGDPDGDPLSYKYWFGKMLNECDFLDEQVYIGSQNGFIKSSLDPDTSYCWKVTACDDKEACTEGPLWTFTTAAANETPVANAGNDQTVEVGPGCTTNVTLNGSGSLDPDGDSLAYAWTYNGGSAEGVDPTIELPLGTHTITLVVNDGIFDSEPDTLIITVQDTTGPAVQVTAPSPGQALQDGVTFSADASEHCEVSGLYFYLREQDWNDGILIGYEDLAAKFNTASGKWEYDFETTLVPDGYYALKAKALDESGNEAWSEPVPFSIRNWAVLELLPASKTFRAGRTMPVKCSLRIAAAVDPQQPFVYNETLEFQIYDGSGALRQTGEYGDHATDYRIDSVGELYITNFKTDKLPNEYTVQIWRTSNNFKIGQFAFETVK